MNTISQQRLFKTMENPEFYPHPVSMVQQMDTHISKVFLAGDYVYKIKKSVDLGFLDFSTLEKRSYYCGREVLLNRRLTHDIYLGVVPITCDNGIYAFRGKGQIADYAVQMRRLSDSASLDRLIKSGKINKVDMYALGWKLALFYSETPPSRSLKPGESWQNLHEACQENFRQTQTCCGIGLDVKKWETVKEATLSFLDNRKPWFTKRFEQGKVRDCHGDLRSGHIYLTNKGIQIIDCIEFNDDLRYIDIAGDLAFLLMDLDFQSRPEFGDCLLNGYLRHTGDLKSFSLLSFYKSYRAFVRCKVNCIFLGTPDIPKDESKKILDRANRYLDLACSYTRQFSAPVVWVVCGMPATGKSTLARELADIFDIKVVRSDSVRKDLFGLSPHDSGVGEWEDKLYSASAGLQTYERLLSLAEKEIDSGNSVILDATYSDARHRKGVTELSKAKGVKPVFIECKADDTLMKARLKEREFRPSVSDARLRHFDSLKTRFETFGPAEKRPIVVDTSFPLDQTLTRILIKTFQMEPDSIIDTGNNP